MVHDRLIYKTQQAPRNNHLHSMQNGKDPCSTRWHTTVVGQTLPRTCLAVQPSSSQNPIFPLLIPLRLTRYPTHEPLRKWPASDWLWMSRHAQRKPRLDEQDSSSKTTRRADKSLSGGPALCKHCSVLRGQAAAQPGPCLSPPSIALRSFSCSPLAASVAAFYTGNCSTIQSLPGPER